MVVNIVKIDKIQVKSGVYSYEIIQGLQGSVKGIFNFFNMYLKMLVKEN